MKWIKSSFCVNDHHCAEIKFEGDSVVIRNSIEPNKKVIFSLNTWVKFIAGVKNGDFD